MWLIGEAIFFSYRLVCWATVKKLAERLFWVFTPGVTLVSPQLMNAYMIGKSVPGGMGFGLFVIEKVGYQAQVILAMLAGVALAFIETNLKRIVPAYL